MSNHVLPPRRSIGVGGIDRNVSNGSPAVHMPTAYDRFDNAKRNSWIDDLQRKIRRGLNGPVSPGPSRSPSPLIGLDNTGRDVLDGENPNQDLQKDEDGDDGQTLQVQVNGVHDDEAVLEDVLSPEVGDEALLDGLDPDAEDGDESQEDQLMSDGLEEDIDELEPQFEDDEEYEEDAAFQDEEDERYNPVEVEDGDEEGDDPELDEEEEEEEEEEDDNGEDEDQEVEDEGDVEDVEGWEGEAIGGDIFGEAMPENQSIYEGDGQDLDNPYGADLGEDDTRVYDEDAGGWVDTVAPLPESTSQTAGSINFTASSSSLFPSLPPTTNPKIPQTGFSGQVEDPASWASTSTGMPQEIDPALLAALAQHIADPSLAVGNETELMSGMLMPPPHQLYSDDTTQAAAAFLQSSELASDEEDQDGRLEEDEPMYDRTFIAGPGGDHNDRYGIESMDVGFGSERDEEEDENDEEEELEEPVEQAEQEEDEESDEDDDEEGEALSPPVVSTAPRRTSHGPTPDDEVIEISSDEEGDDEQQEEEAEDSRDGDDEPEDGSPSEDFSEEEEVVENPEPHTPSNQIHSPGTDNVPSPAGPTHQTLPQGEAGLDDALTYEDHGELPSIFQPDSSTFDGPLADQNPSPPVSTGSNNKMVQHDEDAYESEATPELADPSLAARVLEAVDGDVMEEDPRAVALDTDLPMLEVVELVENTEPHSTVAVVPLEQSVIVDMVEERVMLRQPGEAQMADVREANRREIQIQFEEEVVRVEKPIDSSVDRMDDQPMDSVVDVDMDKVESSVARREESNGRDFSAPSPLVVPESAPDLDQSEDTMELDLMVEEPGSGDDEDEDEDEDADEDSDGADEPSLPDPHEAPRDASMPIPFLLRTPRTSQSPSASVVVAPSEAPPVVALLAEVEIIESAEIREESPIALPDPHERPPDAIMPSPQIPFDPTSLDDRPPSLIVEPPTIPPDPDTVTAGAPLTEGTDTPPALPDPMLAPPPIDTDRFSSLQASDFVNTHYSPTPSLIVEPPDQTPLPSSIKDTARDLDREETPTPLPDPKAPPPDAILQLPVLAPGDIAKVTPSPSLIVEPPVDTLTYSTATTPGVQVGSERDAFMNESEAVDGSDNQQAELHHITDLDSSSFEKAEDFEAEPKQDNPSLTLPADVLPQPEFIPMRHHHGSRQPNRQMPIRSRTRSSQQPSPTPDPEPLGGHMTRSQCFYRKLHLREDVYDAVILVPQCTVIDKKALEEEDAEDLGQPSPMDQLEGYTEERRINVNQPLVDDPLAAKLHRIVGLDVVNEGHCYLLSASENVLIPAAVEEKEDEKAAEEPKTPEIGPPASQGSTRRRRASGRKSAGETQASGPASDSPKVPARQTRSSARNARQSMEPSTSEVMASPRMDRKANRSSASQASQLDSPSATLRRNLRRSTSLAQDEIIDSPAKHTRSHRQATPEDHLDMPESADESTPMAADGPAKRTRSRASLTPTLDTPARKRGRRHGPRASSIEVGRPGTGVADALGLAEPQREPEQDAIPRSADADMGEEDVQVQIITRSGRTRRSTANLSEDAAYRPAEDEHEWASESEEGVQVDNGDYTRGKPRKTRKGKGRAKHSPVDVNDSKLEMETDGIDVKVESAPDHVRDPSADTDAATDIVWDESEEVVQKPIGKRKSRRSLAAMKDNIAFKYDPSAEATPDDAGSEVMGDDSDAPTPGRMARGRKRKQRPTGAMDDEGTPAWKEGKGDYFEDDDGNDDGTAGGRGVVRDDIGTPSKRRAVEGESHSPVAVATTSSTLEPTPGSNETPKPSMFGRFWPFRKK
ncbi:hypothetical protein BD324DRAFT_649109 [Kockovaella imperatae]|uniref:Uncharacterized protein n=1 Tax=Kockovaella imperatae TaxID=4999 RepID=A0A1Y1UNE6_9TREE|nr:hypothetical protein BD324DRAFT_649109 [Kockovaella imperatae]ORX39014.1 hypothetical protein BD324DRAFT_649109 [Kockovaella imperatae]